MKYFVTIINFFHLVCLYTSVSLSAPLVNSLRAHFPGISATESRKTWSPVKLPGNFRPPKFRQLAIVTSQPGIAPTVCPAAADAADARPHSISTVLVVALDRLRGLDGSRHDIVVCTPPCRSLLCLDGIVTMALWPRPSPPPAPLPR